MWSRIRYFRFWMSIKSIVEGDMVNWTRRERCHRGLVDDDFSRFEIGTADDYI